jgi:hypothetical protein
VLLGDGGGGFSVTPSGPFLVGAGVLGITVGDFDRDGAPDVAVLSAWSGYNELTLLLNRILPVSVSPLSINYRARQTGTSNSQTILLTNNLNAALAIGNVALQEQTPETSTSILAVDLVWNPVATHYHGHLQAAHWRHATRHPGHHR